MKKFLPLIITLFAGILLFVWNKAQTRTESVTTPTSLNEEQSAMEKAAINFLAMLTEDQRKEAVLPFQEDARYEWNFVPLKTRHGIMIKTLTDRQRAGVTHLLKSTLSEDGYRKVTGIMQLEQALREVEGRDLKNDNYRDPEKYYLAIFGEPGSGKPWGWRYEGHHLSLNFSSVTDNITVTPAFMGTNPAQVRSGTFKGTEVLKVEQELGRELVKSLDASQKAIAIISQQAPQDIITGNEREARMNSFEGLPYSEMSNSQQQTLTRLLAVYLNNMNAEIAREQMANITNDGLENIHFAWAGGQEPGDAHYYRIHGPGFVIEYDNIQNNANHIHTTWRDLRNDFGGDLLKKHYEDHPHHRE